VAEKGERLVCISIGDVTVKIFNMKTINVNNDGKTFIAFHNDEGLLVLNPILGGNATVCINDSFVATELSGQMQLGSPLFSLPSFTDNIEVARHVRDKLNNISESEFETLENILL